MKMMLREGSVEILEFAKDITPKQFTDFKGLVNAWTGSIFSPSTLSARLKELVEIGALERVVTKTKSYGGMVCYKITPEGLKALEISYSCEKDLQDCFIKKKRT